MKTGRTSQRKKAIYLCMKNVSCDNIIGRDIQTLLISYAISKKTLNV